MLKSFHLAPAAGAIVANLDGKNFETLPGNQTEIDISFAVQLGLNSYRAGTQMLHPSRGQGLAEQGIRVAHDQVAVIVLDDTRLNPESHLAVHAFS